MGRVTKFLQASTQQSDQPKSKHDTAIDRTDHDLQRVITCWPALPKHVKGAILTLINAVGVPKQEV